MIRNNTTPSYALFRLSLYTTFFQTFLVVFFNYTFLNFFMFCECLPIFLVELLREFLQHAKRFNLIIQLIRKLCVTLHDSQPLMKMSDFIHIKRDTVLRKRSFYSHYYLCHISACSFNKLHANFILTNFLYAQPTTIQP